MSSAQETRRLEDGLATDAQTSKMNYPIGMDHIVVLREKIGRLRLEIAQIQQLNKQYRLQGGNSAEAQVAHVQRQERLQAIQQELVQLASLGPKVLSVEAMKERHRSRLHLVKQASSSFGLPRAIDRAQECQAGPSLDAFPT